MLITCTPLAYLFLSNLIFAVRETIAYLVI